MSPSLLALKPFPAFCYISLVNTVTAAVAYFCVLRAFIVSTLTGSWHGNERDGARSAGRA